MPYIGNVPSSFNVGTDNINNDAITTAKIADGTILDADVNSAAAIAGTKINPSFGSQNLLTTGTSTAASFIPSSSTVPTNGLYLPSANNVALSTNGNGRLFIASNGLVGLGIASPSYPLHIAQDNTYPLALQRTTTTTGASFVRFTNAGGNSYIGIDNSTGNAGFATGGAAYALTFVTESANPICFGTNNAERMRLTSTGALGLGTSSVVSKFQISNSGAEGYEFNPGDVANVNATFHYNRTSSAWVANRTGASYHRFDVSGSESMRLTSTGLGIGTATPQSPLVVSNNGANGIEIRPVESDIIAYNRSGASWGDLKINSANNIFQIQGAERARIDNSGRLLVGTSSTTGVAKLQVQGYVGDDNGLGLLALRVGSSSPANGANLGRIDFNDSTDSRGASIGVERDGGTWGASSKPSRLVFSTTADGASSPTERMRITQTGDIGIGIAGTPLAKVDIRQTANANNIFAYKSDTGTASVFALRHDGATGATSRDMIIFGRSDGGTVGSISANGSATAYNTSSDYRLKENIVSLTGAIDRVNQLQVHRFNFIDNPDTTVDGFIAHEAQAVVPECVTGTKDEVDADGNPVYQGIDQSKLVPLLTAALQEAIAKIETLEAKVAALESA